MPQGQGMGFWRRAAGNVLDAFIPGNAFDPHQSSFGQGWAQGDYTQAAHGNRAAQARLTLAYLAKLAGPAASAFAPLGNKMINRHFDNKNQMGPPSELSQYQYLYKDPSEVGPPVEKPQNRPAVPRFAKGGVHAAIQDGVFPSTASQGGGHGFGWQSTNDVGGTMANLSFFGNVAGGSNGDGVFRRAVK